MKTNYIESNCVIEHGGQTFEAGGAVVTDDRLICYLGARGSAAVRDGAATDWHGNKIGVYAITSTWRTPRSFVASTMSQVKVWLTDGRCYTGRSAGEGMIFKGRRVASQRGGR